MNYPNLYSRAAILCRKMGLNETDESVAEFCANTRDTSVYNLSPLELAYLIAEYCGISV
jgi:hypothetical protein